MDIYASDEEKAEEIKRWWRENGRSVVTGVMIGLSLLLGVRYWMNYQQSQTEQAAAIYQQVVADMADGKLTEAGNETDILRHDFSASGYAVFAALQMASETDDVERAKNYLQWVKQHAKLSSHQNLASLRLARLLAANGDLEQALKLITEANSQAYSSLFAELEGDIYKQQGEKKAALTAYQHALSTADGSRQSLLQMKMDDVAVSDES